MVYHFKFKAEQGMFYLFFCTRYRSDEVLVSVTSRAIFDSKLDDDGNFGTSYFKILPKLNVIREKPTKT